VNVTQHYCRRLASSAFAIRPIARAGLLRECSHTRMTVQPSPRSSPVTRLSRLRLVSILFVQNARFVVGRARAQTGHPCQKQPSTNTATFSARHTKSGRPGSGRCLRHPPKRLARKRSSSRSSVLRFPRPRTACIVRDLSGDTPGQRRSAMDNRCDANANATRGAF
jgi:hypothetical protein